VTQPRPAPKTPRPIRDDPRAGYHSVVIAFTVPPHGRTPEQFRARILDKIPALLGYRVGPPEGLDVAVRVIGAGGERSEHEGTVGLTEDVEAIRTTRNVEMRGDRL
jgi:hypothetical protein